MGLSCWLCSLPSRVVNYNYSIHIHVHILTTMTYNCTNAMVHIRMHRNTHIWSKHTCAGFHWRWLSTLSRALSTWGASVSVYSGDILEVHLEMLRSPSLTTLMWVKMAHVFLHALKSVVEMCWLGIQQSGAGFINADIPFTFTLHVS